MPAQSRRMARHGAERSGVERRGAERRGAERRASRSRVTASESYGRSIPPLVHGPDLGQATRNEVPTAP